MESLKPKTEDDEDKESKDGKDKKAEKQDSGLLDLDESMEFLPQVDPRCV